MTQLRKDAMIESTRAATRLNTSWIASQFSSQFLPSREPQSRLQSAHEQTLVRDADKPRWALVVDDVPDVTDMLAVLLTHAGYEVSTACCAKDAIALAREHHFDVVISDIGMPEMNGYELARVLRTLPGYGAVPMVAVTGYSMFDDRSRSLNAGFNEHVTKPIDPRTFLDLIEQL
jgi:CheY-like chemotaxis protein